MLATPRDAFYLPSHGASLLGVGASCVVSFGLRGIHCVTAYSETCVALVWAGMTLHCSQGRQSVLGHLDRPGLGLDIVDRKNIYNQGSLTPYRSLWFPSNDFNWFSNFWSRAENEEIWIKIELDPRIVVIFEDLIVGLWSKNCIMLQNPCDSKNIRTQLFYLSNHM